MQEVSQTGDDSIFANGGRPSRRGLSTKRPTVWQYYGLPRSVFISRSSTAADECVWSQLKALAEKINPTRQM